MDLSEKFNDFRRETALIGTPKTLHQEGRLVVCRVLMSHIRNRLAQAGATITVAPSPKRNAIIKPFPVSPEANRRSRFNR